MISTQHMIIACAKVYLPDHAFFFQAARYSSFGVSIEYRLRLTRSLDYACGKAEGLTGSLPHSWKYHAQKLHAGISNTLYLEISYKRNLPPLIFSPVSHIPTLHAPMPIYCVWAKVVLPHLGIISRFQGKITSLEACYQTCSGQMLHFSS